MEHIKEMKKTSINILCVVIILILAGSVMTPAYYLTSSALSGFVAGWNEAASGNELPESVSRSSVSLYFDPTVEKVLMPDDTVTFDDGRRYPMTVTRASILIKENETPAWSKWTGIVCTFGMLVCAIFLVIAFLKFIININRGEVFVEKNVRLLRRFSILLLVISGFQLLGGIMDDIMISRLNLKLEGYSLSAYWLIPWGNVLLGFLALLIAQVWYRGIRIEEEQKLTI